MAVSLPEKARGGKMVMFSAGSVVVSDKLHILHNVRIITRVLGRVPKKTCQGFSDRNSGVNGICDCAEFQMEVFCKWILQVER